MNGRKTFLMIAVVAWAATSRAKELNVKDFGAVPDGKTDCTGAIQQAIDTAAEKGGGRVVIPAASMPYLVTNTLTVRSSNTELCGDGATLRLADNAVTGSGTHVLRITGTREKGITKIKVRGLTVDANFWGQSEALKNRWNPRGLVVEHVRELVLDRVHVKRAWVSLAFSVGTEDCQAIDCTVSQWHNDGFDAGNGARNIRFVRCRAHNAMSDRRGGLPGGGDGAWDIEDGVQQIRLIDCVVEGTDGEGFTLRSHDTKSVNRDVRFIRCKVLDPINKAWQIVGRDHDTRTEQVLLEDCETPGGLECGNGADLVQVVGGRFGHVTLNAPRRVRIVGSTVQELSIDAREKSDGGETYLPSILLEDVELGDSKPKILGDTAAVRIVNSVK